MNQSHSVEKLLFSSPGRKSREGKVLVLVGLLLVVLLGSVALSVDLGIIMLTRAQLQRASDSGSLAAGTELLPGLGFAAFRNPEEVKALAEPQAVNFVGFHPAGESPSAFIVPSRDMQFGRARMNTNTGEWSFDWDGVPYNAVRVRTLRSATGSTANDGPLPLLFARFLGQNTSNVETDSVAVLMPASGIRVIPGSEQNAGLAPFAFSHEVWDKYWRAHDYWVNTLGRNPDLLLESNGGHEIMDRYDLDENGHELPLFYQKIVQNANHTEFRPLFTDNFSVIGDPSLEGPASVGPGSDGILEVNIYPLNNEAGNFGTVNIGTDSNSTQVLSAQIRDGITEQQLSAYPDGTMTASPSETIELSGNTGISAGIESSLRDIVGTKRAIVLYSDVQNPGNNAIYTISGLDVIRIMDVNLNRNPKTLTIQPDTMSHPSFQPDYNEEIGDRTTMFSPLILAK